jgi:hypothetical protein
MSKPTEYIIEWHDLGRERELAARRGCLPEDIDPIDSFDREDAASLDAAELFARTLRLRADVGYVRIIQRQDIRDDGFADGGHWFPSWEWDEETVNDDI